MAEKNHENVETAGAEELQAIERKAIEAQAVNIAFAIVTAIIAIPIFIYVTCVSDLLQPISWGDMWDGAVQVHRMSFSNMLNMSLILLVLYSLGKRLEKRLNESNTYGRSLWEAIVPIIQEPKAEDETRTMKPQRKPAGRKEETESLKSLRIAYEILLHEKSEQAKITADAFDAVDNAVEEAELAEAEQKLETEEEQFWILIQNCQWFERKLKAREELMIQKFGKLGLFDEFIKEKL